MGAGASPDPYPRLPAAAIRWMPQPLVSSTLVSPTLAHSRALAYDGRRHYNRSSMPRKLVRKFLAVKVSVRIQRAAKTILRHSRSILARWGPLRGCGLRTPESSPRSRAQEVPQSAAMTSSATFTTSLSGGAPSTQLKMSRMRIIRRSEWDPHSLPVIPRS